MKKPIFISYKRVDADKVIPLKKHIESETGVECWIDTDGIESDAQFTNVIIDAINDCEIFLFFYSESHLKSNDANDWTMREIEFAEKKKKRIVLIHLDDSELTDFLLFKYGSKQQIYAGKDKSFQSLIRDIIKWLGIAKKDNSPKQGQDVNEAQEMDRKIIDCNKDISVAFITNDYIYFCFSETGQKIKIPMSSFKYNGDRYFSVNEIVSKVDSMRLSLEKKPVEDCWVYKFCKVNFSLLQSSKIVFIFYTNNVESYIHALDIKETIDGVRTRLMSEDQMALFGFVAREANCKEECTIGYKYRYEEIDAFISEGVIEIGVRRSISSYTRPIVKDIIKGILILYGILERKINNILGLFETSFSLGFITIEDGRVRNVELPLRKYTTIPTRSQLNIILKSNQNLIIAIDDRRATSDTSLFFDQIFEIECYADGEILIRGKKDNMDKDIPLSTLLRYCPLFIM